MRKNLIVKHIFSVILGAFFVNVGIAHFTDTKWFEPIVPSVLGNPTFWVLLTGIMEVLLGLGLILPATRRYAGLLMSGFLVAVYSANLNMWVNDIPLDGNTFSAFWHILRLIAQALMIVIALWVGDWILPRVSDEDN